MYLVYLPYQTSSLLHKNHNNHKGLILTCTYSRQTPPLKHTPLVKGPTHEPPHRVTIFYGNSLSKSLLSPANSTGYQRKKETINLHLALLSLLPSPVPLTSRLCAVAFPFVDHLHHYHHYDYQRYHHQMSASKLHLTLPTSATTTTTTATTTTATFA